MGEGRKENIHLLLYLTIWMVWRVSFDTKIVLSSFNAPNRVKAQTTFYKRRGKGRGRSHNRFNTSY